MLYHPSLRRNDTSSLPPQWPTCRIQPQLLCQNMNTILVNLLPPRSSIFSHNNESLMQSDRISRELSTTKSQRDGRVQASYRSYLNHYFSHNQPEQLFKYCPHITSTQVQYFLSSVGQVLIKNHECSPVSAWLLNSSTICLLSFLSYCFPSFHLGGSLLFAISNIRNYSMI